VAKKNHLTAIDVLPTGVQGEAGFAERADRMSFGANFWYPTAIQPCSISSSLLAVHSAMLAS